MGTLVQHSVAPASTVSPRAMDVLLETIEALSAARSPEDIAAVVRSGARRLTGADGVAVVLRDGDRCHYVDEDAIGPLWKGSKFPMTACISGWAMLNGKTAIIPDIYLDDRIPHDAYRPTFVKSLVMTPVRPDKPVAAIGAYWAQERNPSAEEVEALQAIARATATAFENVRLIASLEEAVERREFLIRELDHRVKNTLASVQAIARQSFRAGSDDPDPEATFGARLKALGHAHEFLALGSWRPAPLRDLALKVLRPLIPSPDRLEIDGPEVTLRPEGALSVAMGLHELGANAAKYGAWCGPQGKVRLTWQTPMVGDERRFELDWLESGAAGCETPARKGTGTDLLTRGLPRALGGQGVMSFETGGLRYRISAPLTGRIALA